MVKRDVVGGVDRGKIVKDFIGSNKVRMQEAALD